MKSQQFEIGMVGLGVMGRNLVLNMSDHGFPVAGYDKDAAKVEALRKESAERKVPGASNIVDFIALLRQPRAIMMAEPAFQRYVVNPVKSRHEMWSVRHAIRHIPPGQILRLIVEASATVGWSINHWATTNQTAPTSVSALNVWFADLLTEDCPDGSVIEFTFFWKDAQRWEGRNYSVTVLET